MNRHLKIDIFDLFRKRQFTYISIFSLFIFDLFCIFREYYFYSMLTSSLIIGSLVSIYFYPINLNESSLELRLQKNISLPLILFFLFYSLSIIYLIFFELLYTKSFIYYFFIGLCASLIFFISFFDSKFSTPSFISCLILLLGFNVFLSNFITFPNGIYTSGDTHYHIYKLLLPLIKNGVFPLNDTYTSFPLHHIFVACASIITNIDPIKLYFFANSIIYVGAILFMYLLSRHIFDIKVGIISMLFFMISPSVVYNANHPYQFSYAFPLGILLMFITIICIPSNFKNNLTLRNRSSFITLLVFLIPTIIWMHQFTSTVVFSLSLLLLFFSYVLSLDKNKLTFIGTTSLLYLCTLFFHWMFVSNGLLYFVNIGDFYFHSLFTPENYQSALTVANSNFVSTTSFWIIFSNSFGTSILFFLSILGFYYGVFQKNSSVLVMTSLGMFIWSLFSIGSFIHMPLLLGGRLLSFFWPSSVVFLASLGIVAIVKKFKLTGVLICFILIFLVTIFNLGSLTSGPETSIFVGNQPYLKLYDTNSDLESYRWIKQNIPITSAIKAINPWVPQYMDSEHIYGPLNFDDSNHLVLPQNNSDYSLLSVSISHGVFIKDALNLDRVSKVKFSEVMNATSELNTVYSNGQCYVKCSI